MITDSFRESKEEFQKFLAAQGLSSDLLWIFREDLICLPTRILIKVPLPEKNEILAETLFDTGREQNFGICLNAFCSLDGKICCYVQLPNDGFDAQCSLMSNEHVKFSVRTNPLNAEPVTNVLFWRFYRLVEKFSYARYCMPDNMPIRGVRFHSVTSALSFDASRG
jgi:hypothetical protein